MPAIITHYLFGKEVQRRACLEPPCPSTYNWGTQGPDFLFFALPPGRDSRRLNKTGSLMHETGIEKNLAFLCESVRAAHGPEKDALVSYLFGYLAHFILDSTMHPFVYGMQRHFKTVLPAAGDDFLHRKIETNLDVLFLARFRSTDIRRYRIADRFRLRPELDHVCRMYSRLLHENYGAGIGFEHFRKAFADMKTVYSLLYSPHGIRRRLFGAVERAAGSRYPAYAALAHTAECTDEIDYANLAGVIRENGNEALEHNAFELFEIACGRYLEAAAALKNRLETGVGNLSIITQGLNFEGEKTPETP